MRKEEDVSVGIANAYLTVEKFTAKKAIDLGAVNVQLTINDKESIIEEIKTEQVCQVILEDGTSDSIPTPKVSGDGELKQINMKAAGKMELLALTLMSGLTTVAKQGEAIDFSTAVVLGTYQSDDGVTVFKAGGLSYNLTETFSKLEKDFTIKINDKSAYKEGKNDSTFNWSALAAGKYTAVLDIDYQYKKNYNPYQFDIVIIGKAENQTEIVIPTFELTKIEAQTGMAKTVYAEGEPLNLAGLLVMGTYTASVGNIPSYQSVVKDYTLDPPNGTILSVNDTIVKVKVKGMSDETINITVKPIWNVTFVMDASDDHGTIVLKVVQGEKAAKPNDPTRIGYTFGGWYADSEYQTEYNFGTIVQNTTVYAKWNPIEYAIEYAGVDGAVNPNNVAKYTIENEITLAEATKVGYIFDGWYLDSEKVTKIAKGTIGNITLTAHWTPSTNTPYKVVHYLQNANDDGYTFDSTDDKTGTTGEQTAAAAKNYDHFTAETITQATIKADGSTVVRINYKREIITFTFRANGGKWNGGSTEDKVVFGRYQSEVNVPNLEVPTRDGYTFSGWDVNSDNTPDDVETSFNEAKYYTAVWTSANVISWSIDPYSDIHVNVTSDADTITITADDEYTNYSWLIDGMASASGFTTNGRVLTVTKANLTADVVYQISLTAKKAGMLYGTQIAVKR